MLKKLVRSLVRKHGMRGLLIKIGDWAVSASKNKEDETHQLIQHGFRGRLIHIADPSIVANEDICLR